MYKRLILQTANRFETPFKQNELVADRYKILKTLGAGSYGYTYLVRDQLSQHIKVLKALRIHKRITRSGLKGFEREKSLLQTIEHSGFPKYFEEGTSKNIPFYTMEYIKGKNFEQLIFEDGKTYTEIEAFSIGLEVLDLLEYLHVNQIIHRDIRIPNVLSSDSGLRLIDLGLSVKLEQTSRDRHKRDLRKEVRVQADFYGLGHFLLFLLYSNFTFPHNKKESSWEEELDISKNAKQIIKKLLQIEIPYESCVQIKSDIMKIINI